ncbi:tail fiber protein [Paraglaciecola aquimarina]|uniref:Tail fiber protein n=1 Tax=Paraglaciecola algarum TaxID=3050085 RepID=A0ABS9D6S5_9ALTE|nr:tail fiber protein [Paraglaciecola sp. G1-23]MCF2948643.1 tail fiber protein [Paraglaciecola sp. G1-23]
MSDPFIGEITMFGGNFAPRGWALCDGQLLAISGNSALFSLLGTTYGGDGRSTFGLPDLRGRVPIHEGQGAGLSPKSLGSKGGSETNTLNANNLPSHTHAAVINCVAGAGNANTAAGNVWSADAGNQSATYSNSAPNGTMQNDAIELADTGGGQSVNNMQPYQVVNYIIALVGTYPSRN